FSKNEDLMTVEEIDRISKILAFQGVKKVRLTGGEPFMRKDIMDIFQVLTKHFRYINLTTNGSLIGPYIDRLKDFSIGSVNLSLDSMDRENFFRITKRDQFEAVFSIYHQLLGRGIRVKVNKVVMKGINDHEIPDFVRLAEKDDVSVRFIEAMPFNAHDGNHDQFMDCKTIEAKIRSVFPELIQVETEMNASSLRFAVPNFAGDI